MKPKYVIIDGNAIVFSASIAHVDMVGRNQKATSAGFVLFACSRDGEPIAQCYGESFSLGIKSNEEDSAIVTRQIVNPYM